MERDVIMLIPSHHSSISTHTLTWSVTINRFFSIMDFIISTHTLTWSVT